MAIACTGDMPATVTLDFYGMERAMTDDDERLMNAYGIRSETKEIFWFGKFRYDRLSDAVDYAEKQRSSAQVAVDDQDADA